MLECPSTGPKKSLTEVKRTGVSGGEPSHIELFLSEPWFRVKVL